MAGPEIGSPRPRRSRARSRACAFTLRWAGPLAFHPSKGREFVRGSPASGVVERVLARAPEVERSPSVMMRRATSSTSAGLQLPGGASRARSAEGDLLHPPGRANPGGENEDGPIAAVDDSECPWSSAAPKARRLPEGGVQREEVKARGGRVDRGRDRRGFGARETPPTRRSRFPETLIIDGRADGAPAELLAYYIAVAARLQRGPAAEPRQNR